MEIAMHAQVFCTDGFFGPVSCVILNPKLRQVTHLAAREQRKGGVERLIPIRFAIESDHDKIRLGCDIVRTRRFDPLMVVEFVSEGDPNYRSEERSTVKFEQLPSGTIALRRGAHVHATDGKVGTVDSLLIDLADRQITHLVLREGHLWGQKDVTIAIGDVDSIGEKKVCLNLSKREVDKLPAIPTRRSEKQHAA